MTEPVAQPQGVELPFCPFCGKLPETGITGAPECDNWRYVKCSSNYCPIRYSLFTVKGWRTRADLPRATAGDSCWHCGVVLAGVSKARCESCPDECDIEGCDALGCSTPRATGETGLTVEAALKELREMFPDAAISIEIHDYTGVAGSGNGYVKVLVDWRSTTHPSIDACMEIARHRWAKSRAASERGGE